MGLDHIHYLSTRHDTLYPIQPSKIIRSDPKASGLNWIHQRSCIWINLWTSLTESIEYSIRTDVLPHIGITCYNIITNLDEISHVTTHLWNISRIITFILLYSTHTLATSQLPSYMLKYNYDYENKALQNLPTLCDLEFWFGETNWVVLWKCLWKSTNYNFEKRSFNI